MDRVAVFVDAGYLFASGSVLLAGSTQRRSLLTLDEAAIIAEFSELALAKSGLPLLRIYWYDGAQGYGPSAVHLRLASMDSVKVRLGFINSAGQQKGVDSLIVTDLIDLARNNALADAILMSGDEDVRIGVQVAQSYGARVHLVGIEPSRSNQSPSLRQEADTTTEWARPTVEKVLSLRASVASTPAATHSAEGVAITVPQTQAADPSVAAVGTLDKVVLELLNSLAPDDVANIATSLGVTPGVPRPWDGRMLAEGRTRLGRDLTIDERQYLRKRFVAQFKATCVAASPPQV